MTVYRDTSKWKLINNFTIHEDKELTDRPYMQTKVPKRLWLDMKNIQLVDACEWSGSSWVGALSINEDGNLISDAPDEERKGEHNSERYITASATFEDKITVFSLADGALLQFHEIAKVRISPMPRGRIGGKNNATVFDGIGFSGMSSKRAPDKGLMEGEPGGLYLLTDAYPDSMKGEEPSLHLEVHLEKGPFENLFDTMAKSPAKIEKATMNTLIELFENELQAALNDPWMDSEYGLLQHEGNRTVSARARIDGIQVFYSKSPSEPIDLGDGAVEEGHEGEGPSKHVAIVDDSLLRLTRSVRARLSLVIGILVALLATLLLTK